MHTYEAIYKGQLEEYLQMKTSFARENRLNAPNIFPAMSFAFSRPVAFPRDVQRS